MNAYKTNSLAGVNQKLTWWTTPLSRHFRERVIAAVKKSQLNSPAIQAQFEATLKQHTDGKVLISQPLAGDLFTTYVRMAVTTNHPFTLLSTNDATTEDDPIAVLTSCWWSR